MCYMAKKPKQPETTSIRLDDDLALRIEAIRSHYNLTGRTQAIRLAVKVLSDNLIDLYDKRLAKLERVKHGKS